MSRQVKSVIYYDGQIYNTEFDVVFVGVKSVKLTFNSTIQMYEIMTRIKKSVEGSSRGRITRLQCRFLAFVDPYKHELFDVISKTHLEIVISLDISSENVIIELYLEFVNVDGFGPSSTSVVTNMVPSGYQHNPNLDTRPRHSISAFDFNFSTRSMLWDKNSYTGRSSTYTDHQLEDYSSGHMGYKRINDLFLSIRVDEGMPNTVLEGDNEGADKERDAGEGEGVANVNEEEEAKPELFWQHSLDGSEMALFFKPDPVTIESKPCESDDDTSDNASDPDQ
ncbi:hypothetical protein PVK06_012303 [Gossypium arboreum]|uniref:Uncharacterized protein n=1 Tax=Gossypium arboreum TaxID=29729 RepID=A0ABR0QBS3_GOSAR|nr:hypothetical protein PVK06_012303 [Gossypium arboreum]